MASTLSDVLFALCAVAIATAQWFILRSTARGMRHADAHVNDRAGAAQPAGTGHTAREWAYAFVPALALAALLAFTWLAMHPDTVNVRGIAPSSIGTDA